jgi:hypothetical protein
MTATIWCSLNILVLLLPVYIRSVTVVMTDFKFSLSISGQIRYSIIRFPNDGEIYTSLVRFTERVPSTEFYSLTRTRKEISVIQEEKHPLYLQELGGSKLDLLQIEKGFALIEVVPAVGEQIDFGDHSSKHLLISQESQVYLPFWRRCLLSKILQYLL